MHGQRIGYIRVSRTGRLPLRCHALKTIAPFFLLAALPILPTQKALSAETGRYTSGKVKTCGLVSDLAGELLLGRQQGMSTHEQMKGSLEGSDSRLRELHGLMVKATYDQFRYPSENRRQHAVEEFSNQ